MTTPTPTLHSTVRDWALSQPDALAVVGRQRRLTYAELVQAIDARALELRDAGVGAGDIVGIILPRGPAAVIAMLSVLSCGAAYLPCDPDAASDRTSYALGDARVKAVITSQGDATDRWLIERRDNPARVGLPADLAYVIYTSGSTGRPKGVMVRHTSLSNYLAWITTMTRMGPNRHSCAHTSLAYDLAITGLWGPLFAGGAVWLVPEEDRLPALARLITDEPAVSVFKLTPGHLRLLAAMSIHDRVSGDITFVVGGEALLAKDVAPWHGRVELINHYGPTEATVGCCAFRLGDGPLPGQIPIGYPVDGGEAHVVTDDGTSTVGDEPGQLLIGGRCLSAGYLGLPDQTAERFAVNPRVSDEVLYHTGDIVRRLPGGELTFIGRADNQVKIKGFRVELNEVATVLRERGGLADAQVFLAGSGERPRLVAVAVSSDRTADPDAILAGLAAWLPDYMRPDKLVLVDRIPLTANGKADRDALRRLGDSVQRKRSSTPSVHRFVGRDELEVTLASIWAKVLDYDAVDIDDDFFALGGDSLLAIELVVAIEEHLSLQLGVEEVATHPTPARQADLLRSRRGERPVRSLVPLQPEGAQTPIFAVHPVGGTVLWYAHLSRALGPAQPFFGLQARGLDPRVAPDTTIPDMARHYVGEVEDVSADGCVLLGYSFGGVVAAEVAQQLRERDRHVPLLVILDAPSHPPAARPVDYGIGVLAHRALKLNLPDDTLDQLSREEQLALILREGIAQGTLPKGYGLDRLQRMVSIYDFNGNAIQRYDFRRVDCDVLLIRAKEGLWASVEDPTLGWQVAEGRSLHVDWVSSDHFSILDRPNAGEVAASIRRHLNHHAQPPDSRPDSVVAQ